MQKTHVVLMLVLASALGACDGCGARGELKASFGELAVVWQDSTFARRVDRDATFDFGYALVGQERQAVVLVKNVGTSSLSLERLTLVEGEDVAIAGEEKPNAHFAMEFSKKTLAPSQETPFLVTFSPKFTRSSFKAKLRLEAEGTLADANFADITLVAQGDASTCDLPEVIELGRVPVGETFSFPFVFRNGTQQDTEATIAGYEGGDAQAFGFGTDTQAGKVPVPAAGSDSVPGEKSVQFTFSPTELREYQVTLKLAGPGPRCEVVNVTVKGTGVDEVLTWTPSMLKFGLVPPGSEKELEVVFTNTASIPVTLRNIAPPQDFRRVVPMGVDAATLVVPPNGVPTAMKVACAPSALGNRNGTLSFEPSLTKLSRGAIALECAGGGPRIRVTPRPTLAFGAVPFFQGNPTPATRRVSVQNVGLAPMNPDASFNLILGKVDPYGMPGQMPMYEVRPTSPDTQPGEFSVTLGGAYDGRVGIRPVAGMSELPLVVNLLPRSPGLKSAELTIYSNDAIEPAITVTVTANVQILSPCNFRVTPQLANFGLVPAGTTKDIPITITNNGTGRGDACVLTNFGFGPNSDPAYSFVGTVPTEKELRPQETWQLVLRVRPPGPAPTSLITLQGQLTFDISSPNTPTVQVDLRTSVGPSCIAATPDPLDFGTVRLVPPPGMRCASPNKTVTIYNTCTTPIVVNRISMAAAAGQPAGGPACAGSQPCPEFFLVQTPNIPMNGITLAAGSAPLAVQLRYSPLDLGTDSGAIALDVTQSGQTVQYLVAMTGRGDTGGRQVDTFVQDRQPRADILLVVDNSCSMSSHQMSVASNFNSFIQYAQSANVDYQLGVVTTDNGTLRPTTAGRRFISSQDQNAQAQFSSLVQVGINGSGSEMPLQFATAAVTSPLIAGANAGFIRPDANLAIVVVTDTEDQSSQPAAFYQNQMINVKGFSRLSQFTFSVIGPFFPQNMRPTGCVYDDILGRQARYTDIITATSGVREEICNSNWSAALQGLGRTAFGFRTQFYLTNNPDTTTGGPTVTVLIDGRPVPPSAYTYDPATNSVQFLPTATPQPGQSLSVDYQTTCF